MSKPKMILVTIIWILLGLLITDFLIDREYKRMLYPNTEKSFNSNNLQAPHGILWLE